MFALCNNDKLSNAQALFDHQKHAGPPNKHKQTREHTTGATLVGFVNCNSLFTGT